MSTVSFVQAASMSAVSAIFKSSETLPEFRMAMKARNQDVYKSLDRYGIKLVDIATHCENTYNMELSIVDCFKYSHLNDLAYSVYENDVLIIVFRGTIADNQVQWIQNLSIPVEMLFNKFTAGDMKYKLFGKIGWECNAEAIIDKFLVSNTNLNALRPKIICCGHSRGGYLALLGAAYLLKKLNTLYPNWNPKISVVGFGMPIFESLTENMLRLDTISCYIHMNDLVGKYISHHGYICI